MKTQEELIREEQRILDELIRQMDAALLKLNKKLNKNDIQKKKEKAKVLPEAYGDLVSAQHDKIQVKKNIKSFRRGRDELYDTRIVVEYDDGVSKGIEDIKVGLHSYISGSDIYIMSWKMPLCRHYILDNSAEEYDGVVKDKYGNRYFTHYQLKLKRQVDLFFDKVKAVTHFFPLLDEETEQIIADEFLQELLKRRSEQEFKNIVFSIQKQQGEIIQTPFKQNMIVQGCAGSGKSMIMLHRLPIIIYDNPNSLDRNNLYIITPSIAYIQMAENMRMDLEIEDLKMGTLEQYYDHVIGKYNRKADEYGKTKPFLKLSKEQLQYVYSKDCIEDIRRSIVDTIECARMDYSMGFSLLGLGEGSRESKNLEDILRGEILTIQRIINENEKILRLYYRQIKELVAHLDEFARWFETRYTAVTRGVLQKISEEKRTIAEKEKELKTINQAEHEVAYQNRMNSIKSAHKKIADYEETMEIVELDNDYFEDLKKYATQIRQLIALVAQVKNERENVSISDQYEIISERNNLCECCKRMLEQVSALEDPYWEFAQDCRADLRKIETAANALSSTKHVYVPETFYLKLLDTNKRLTDISTNIIKDTYLKCMEKLGQKPDDKGRLTALSCSPYLYLQVLYTFYGTPKAASESLITIDEAQNMAPEELRLIKVVNNDKVVLNLFGDVKQHVEGSKGIDDWKEIRGIASFDKQDMRENYRNARQITDYCNKRFRLKMRAINLDGKGVHELKSYSDFESGFFEVFQKPQNPGLSCILVKNAEEADAILEIASLYKNRIHDMTKEWVEIMGNKWNLMTAEQAKGLEFETVFAVSGTMTQNEKYIAYTRALDELYVYDTELPILEKEPEKKTETKEETVDKQQRKKREKRSSKKKLEETSVEAELKNVEKEALTEFLNRKGLSVVDFRNKGGALWVLGGKEIEATLNESTNEYGAQWTFFQNGGKATGFRTSWYTKSKK